MCQNIKYTQKHRHKLGLSKHTKVHLCICIYAHLHKLQHFYIRISTLTHFHTQDSDWNTYAGNTKQSDCLLPHDFLFSDTHRQTLCLISICQAERWKDSLTFCAGLIYKMGVIINFPHTHVRHICARSYWQIEKGTVNCSGLCHNKNIKHFYEENMAAVEDLSVLRFKIPEKNSSFLCTSVNSLKVLCFIFFNSVDLVLLHWCIHSSVTTNLAFSNSVS